MRRYWVLSAALAAILFVNLPAFAAGDFTITATPPSATVDSGGSTTFTVSASPTGGFSGKVNLAASVSPATADVSVSFAKNPLQPSTDYYGYAHSDQTSMTVTTSGMAAGAFTITVTGTNGALSHSSTVTLQVTTTTTSTTTTTTSTTSSTTSSSSTTTSTSMTKASITSTSRTTSTTSSTTTSSSTTTTSTAPPTTASTSTTSTTTTTGPPPTSVANGLNPALIGAGGVVGIAIVVVAVTMLRRRGGGS